jgi:hypothetical protein
MSQRLYQKFGILTCKGYPSVIKDETYRPHRTQVPVSKFQVAHARKKHFVVLLFWSMIHSSDHEEFMRAVTVASAICSIRNDHADFISDSPERTLPIAPGCPPPRRFHRTSWRYLVSRLFTEQKCCFFRPNYKALIPIVLSNCTLDVPIVLVDCY